MNDYISEIESKNIINHFGQIFYEKVLKNINT